MFDLTRLLRKPALLSLKKPWGGLGAILPRRPSPAPRLHLLSKLPIPQPGPSIEYRHWSAGSAGVPFRSPSKCPAPVRQDRPRGSPFFLVSAGFVSSAERLDQRQIDRQLNIAPSVMNHTAILPLAPIRSAAGRMPAKLLITLTTASLYDVASSIPGRRHATASLTT